MKYIRSKCIKYVENLINYYESELEAHRDLDTDKFPYEQLLIYKKNVKKFQERIGIYQYIKKMLEENE
ncbi:MAG: hypothetical protein FWC41_07050 [Firmicutes bacterium]|nr:hypothetical protein [Bacillota bacterium]